MAYPTWYDWVFAVWMVAAVLVIVIGTMILLERRLMEIISRWRASRNPRSVDITLNEMYGDVHVDKYPGELKRR